MSPSERDLDHTDARPARESLAGRARSLLSVRYRHSREVAIHESSVHLRDDHATRN
jgi:hypothetical protein